MRPKTSLTAAALLSGACILLPARSTPQAGEQEPTCGARERLVVGLVREEPGGRPLSGLPVQVIGTPHRVTTDSAGWYRIRLPVGHYEVMATGPRFYPERRRIQVHEPCQGLTICRPMPVDGRPCPRDTLNFYMRVIPPQLET
jgi:carboxypeptidase family protein